MGQSSNSMIESLGDTMSFLNSLEEEFRRLKDDTSKLQTMNQEMHHSLNKIETTYVKRSSHDSY